MSPPINTGQRSLNIIQQRKRATSCRCFLCGLPVPTWCLLSQSPGNTSNSHEENERLESDRNKLVRRKGLHFIFQNLDAEELWDSCESKVEEKLFCFVCTKLMQDVHQFLFEIEVLELKLDAKVADAKERILKLPIGNEVAGTSFSVDSDDPLEFRKTLVDKVKKTTLPVYPIVKLRRVTDSSSVKVKPLELQDQGTDESLGSKNLELEDVLFDDYFDAHGVGMDVDDDANSESVRTDSPLDTPDPEPSTSTRSNFLTAQLPDKTGKKLTNDSSAPPSIPRIMLSRVEIPKLSYKKSTLTSDQELADDHDSLSESDKEAEDSGDYIPQKKFKHGDLDFPKKFPDGQDSNNEDSMSELGSLYVPSSPGESDSDFENEPSTVKSEQREMKLKISNPRSLSKHITPTASLTHSFSILPKPNDQQKEKQNSQPWPYGSINVQISTPAPLSLQPQILATVDKQPENIMVPVVNPPATLTSGPPQGKTAISRRIYRCDYCPIVFDNKLPVVGHYQEFHAGKPRFCCSECTREFILSQDLVTHLKRDHDTVVPESALAIQKIKGSTHPPKKIALSKPHSSVHGNNCLEEKPRKPKVKLIAGYYPISETEYHCGICSEPHDRQIHLIGHFKEKHVGMKPFKCPKDNCGFSFWKLSLVRRHVEKGHVARQSKNQESLATPNVQDNSKTVNGSPVISTTLEHFNTAQSKKKATKQTKPKLKRNEYVLG